MGDYIFRLPDIGEGVAEAEIVAWHVRVGDRVEADQALVDVMTDKASVEMISPVRGVVRAVHGEVGEKLAVGAPLAEFEVDGASPDAAPTPAPPSPAIKTAPPTAALAAPAVRARARALGVALETVPGSGPDGRVTAADLEAHVAALKTPAAPDEDGVTEVKIVGLRRRIAERMQDAARRIPHFTYVEEFDLTELEALRRQLNADKRADQPKLTLLAFLMRAVVAAAPEFPQVNAHFDDAAEVLRQHRAVHIGVATQTPDGLVVPVVRHAEARDLWACAAELARVSGLARAGKAGREDLSGSTITLTSLGALGGVAATPIINAPEVAILGPNRLIERPVIQNGHVVARQMMNLSSSFDHRVVDGYDAASFIRKIKTLMERPALLFMD